ncbi:hypothetical protein [Nocardiopsis sp. CC223A]|uniref:hypothetical protein n=1 Tax=Nocardiopsis sp. CC223A TaxID=3044051 RepID=UPI00278C25B3|nr:hypothetical protein [Nocardiopsis sp. CC223A]
MAGISGRVDNPLRRRRDVFRTTGPTAVPACSSSEAKPMIGAAMVPGVKSQALNQKSPWIDLNQV